MPLKNHKDVLHNERGGAFPSRVAGHPATAERVDLRGVDFPRRPLARPSGEGVGAMEIERMFGAILRPVRVRARGVFRHSQSIPQLSLSDRRKRPFHHGIGLNATQIATQRIPRCVSDGLTY